MVVKAGGRGRKLVKKGGVWEGWLGLADLGRWKMKSVRKCSGECGCDEEKKSLTGDVFAKNYCILWPVI